MKPEPPDLRLEGVLRDLAPQVLGAVVRRARDFAACEDAVQEALIAAAAQWPRDGVPGNPRGWLIRVALRRLTDHIRSEIARRPRSTPSRRSILTTRWCCSSCAATRRSRRRRRSRSRCARSAA